MKIKFGLILVVALMVAVQGFSHIKTSIPKAERENLKTCGVSIVDGDLLNELNQLIKYGTKLRKNIDCLNQRDTYPFSASDDRTTR